jgi:hypothetical protein
MLFHLLLLLMLINLHVVRPGGHCMHCSSKKHSTAGPNVVCSDVTVARMMFALMQRRPRTLNTINSTGKVARVNQTKEKASFVALLSRMRSTYWLHGGLW